MPLAPTAQQVPNMLMPDQMRANSYRADVMKLFQSLGFMNGSEDQRKQMVGTYIFREVTRMVGEEFSPKITGMIIDLPMADLNYSVSTLDMLNFKVRSAVQLLVETNNAAPDTIAQMPMNSDSKLVV